MAPLTPGYAYAFVMSQLLGVPGYRTHKVGGTKISREYSTTKTV